MTSPSTLGLLCAGLLLVGDAREDNQAGAASSSCGAAAEAGCCASTAEFTPPRVDYLSLPPASQDAVRGTARGRIVFAGEIPPKEKLEITEAQSKGCTDDGSKVAADVRSLLIGEDRGIANAVVFVVVKGEELVLPKEPVVLDQVQCRFTQPVTLVPAGATLEYKNSDTVPHNVHVYCIRNKPFNKTLPAGATQKHKVEIPETLQLRCDIHPWMRSYVFVSGTNHATLTDAHGAFELPGLPPGEYTLRVWHEKLGRKELPFSIDAEGASEPLEVEMKAKERKSRRRR